ncbi:MAG: helix-turn-helix domain-containing protein [Chloroflexi bacterium]|nr:helix-turn-helix domain-containing protein [Chloroflexota bacterium]
MAGLLPSRDSLGERELFGGLVVPTVEQVWRAMPPRTELAAGEAGVYNGISWAVTLRPTPPAFDRLTGNELALIDAVTVKELGATLPSLVTSLVEQGVGAIAVLGEVLPEAREQADRYKTPLLCLPQGSDLRALETSLNAFINEERYWLYQREQDLTRQLMDLALSGRGVEAILEKLQSLSGRPVALLGPDFEPRSIPSDQELPEIRKLLSRLLPSPPTAIVGLRLSDRFTAFLSLLSGKQGVEGFLLIIAPAGELQEADRLAARVGALALAVEMSRDQAVVDTEERFQAEMMESILSSELSPQALRERAKRLGLSSSQSYVAMAAQPTSSSHQGEVLARKASAALGQALCYPRGNVLAIIHPVAPTGVLHDLRRMGKEVARKLSDGLGMRVSLGVGRVSAGVEGLRASFQEAERALTVGKRLFGDGSVSLFADLGVYRLLLSLDPDEVKDFYQESIGRLAAYDRQHGGELMHTLEALLRYPTVSEAAKVLHVHRNTLLYRLQRIQEIANLDLEDGETRLVLHLALKAGEVIRAG